MKSHPFSLIGYTVAPTFPLRSHAPIYNGAMPMLPNPLLTDLQVDTQALTQIKCHAVRPGWEPVNVIIVGSVEQLLLAFNQPEIHFSALDPSIHSNNPAFPSEVYIDFLSNSPLLKTKEQRKPLVGSLEWIRSSHGLHLLAHCAGLQYLSCPINPADLLADLEDMATLVKGMHEMMLAAHQHGPDVVFESLTLTNQHTGELTDIQLVRQVHEDPLQELSKQPQYLGQPITIQVHYNVPYHPVAGELLLSMHTRHLEYKYCSMLPAKPGAEHDSQHEEHAYPSALRDHLYQLSPTKHRTLN